MCIPENIEIDPGDSVQEADEKVTRAYGALGAKVQAFEHLNTLLPTSSFCHFFHVELESCTCVAVVNSQPWDENSVLAVLNILLNIRVDPDPPGQSPLFRFYSAYPVAPVLLTLFGDSSASDFECRAATVVGYAADVYPAQSFQLAAVGMHLLRECLGVRTSLQDPGGEEALAQVMGTLFRADSFPEGGAPLNSLIALGFFYGEFLRSQLPYLSRWVRLRDHSPWPVLAFGQRPEGAGKGGRAEAAAEPQAEGAAGRPPEKAEKSEKSEESEDELDADEEASGVSDDGACQVVFNPIATVISVYQGNPPESLAESRESLVRRCEEVLGVFDEN